MVKKKLDDAYLDADMVYINRKVQTLEEEHICKQHHLAWNTVKELAGKNYCYKYYDQRWFC